MKRRKLIRIKREIQDNLFSAVRSAKEEIYGEIQNINNTIWESKKRVNGVLDRCNNVEELLNNIDFTLTGTINDITDDFSDLLVNVEKKYHDNIIYTGESIFNKYGLKGLNSNCVDLCKFEFTKYDKDWIIKESDNLVYEAEMEVRDYIIEDAKGFSNSPCSFDYKISEYKKLAKQMFSEGIDHLAESILQKVIEYYIVELVDNIKITKKCFDLLIDRNADLSKQLCDGKVDIKNDSNVEKGSAMDSDSQDILKINFISSASSGKSTLINALLNTELLPSENKACTATICKILDNDTMDHYEATCYADDGITEIYPRQIITLDSMKEFNSNGKVTYIDIEGSVPAIPSDKIRLCLRDTPGPNNSRDENHSRLTNNIIKGTNSVVLYVMNATQIAIKDDEQLLRTISNEMRQGGKQARDRFIFVINKCDALDEEKGETVDKLLQSVREYLNEFDITEPTLIPTSARMALLIRKNMRGEGLSRNERNTLNDINDFIEVKELHFEEFATLTPTVKENLQDKIREYSCDEYKREFEALIHTGIPAVEATIAEYIDKYAYPMKVKDAIKDIVNRLDEINMKAEFEKSIAIDKEQLSKVREQIKIAKDKNNQGKYLYDEYKGKINEFKLDSSNESEAQYNVERELNQMIRPYDGKSKIDKRDADYMVSDFQHRLEDYQRDCECRLNREIENKIFGECKKLLEDYSYLVKSIIDNIEIENFDFNKIRAFDSIKISNLYDIQCRNEHVRYRSETRVKDNPERRGFTGFFKFWKKKQISYTVNVEDGIDVDVRAIIVNIMSSFSSSIKRNISDMFKQANDQVEEYKTVFNENIDLLNTEITNILEKLDYDTKESSILEERVKENQTLANWFNEKDKAIRQVLEF